MRPRAVATSDNRRPDRVREHVTAAALAEDVVRIKFRGPLAAFMRDQTRMVDLEGALSSGKTTACLTKEYLAAQQYPGQWSLICRFADGDTSTKLIPAWDRVCQQFGELPTWNAKEEFYGFANGSRVYAFGLFQPKAAQRYAKLRGFGGSRIYVDQAEEMPQDFLGELVLRLRQQGYPHQLTLSPNPMGENDWLTEDFPEDNTRPNRKHYSISIFDNAHNLPAEMIQDALAAYPVTHAGHRSKILGKRGLNVTGKPVYGGAFDRSLHVKPYQFNPELALEEGLDFGKHHPCIVWRQRTPYGGVRYLGGIMGQSVYLEDFLPIVKAYRAEWFPNVGEIRTCCDPAGAHGSSQGLRGTGVGVLREHGFSPVWQDGANRPSVRATIMERIAGQMRRRTPMGEAYGINSDPTRWIRVMGDGRPPATWHFLADGDEAGYVWDEHMVSEGSKQYRRADKDGWYEHGQNTKEYLELNFGVQAVPVKAPVQVVRPQPRRPSWAV